jgi:hypothetical protein
MCEWLARRLDGVVIDRGGQPYLERYYLRHGDPNGRFPWQRWSLFLHHFVGSDPDEEHHNHPTDWAHSVVLAGSFYESRCTRTVAYPSALAGQEMTWVKNHGMAARRAGQVYGIDGQVFHRIIVLPGQDAWTLFLRGPRVKSWGFLLENGTVTEVRGRTFDNARKVGA